MKFSAAAALFAASSAVAVPVDTAPGLITLGKRGPGGIDYTQNYNGGAANFQYNQDAGTYSCSWNGNTDFVVGLGWSTGSAR
jgi:endo-1,4-beta-xylanase